MKFKLTALLVFLCLGLTSTAQKKKVIETMPGAEAPIDESTKLISYTLKLETSLPDSVLYKRAMHWYKTEIKSMRVDPEKTTEKSFIYAQGEFTLLGPQDKKGHAPKSGRIKFTMTTEIKGSVAITTVTKINKSATNYTPVEPWLEEQKEDYLKKFYLLNIEEQIDDILRSYKKFVNVTMH